ncbi:MAG: hypothetical protein KGJ07_01085 [Patescibacteria group bacterium]|nr:hypothetical protein [Patescibacteria group bacterium]MDE2589353.1 hypothetical protein [Patescibacteria group bacterium]
MVEQGGYFANLYEAARANGYASEGVEHFVAEQEAMLHGVVVQTILEDMYLPYLTTQDMSGVIEGMQDGDWITQVPSAEGAEVSFRFPDIRMQMLAADIFTFADTLSNGKVVVSRASAREAAQDFVYATMKVRNGGGAVVRGVLENVGQQAGRARVIRCDLLAQGRRGC